MHRSVACAGSQTPGGAGVRSAMDITAQNSLILQGGGNYRLAPTDSFDAHVRRARPFWSPRRVRFFNTTRKEQTK